MAVSLKKKIRAGNNFSQGGNCLVYFFLKIKLSEQRTHRNSVIKRKE